MHILFSRENKRMKLSNIVVQRRALEFIIIQILYFVHGESSHQFGEFSGGHYHDQIRELQGFKSSLTRRRLASTSSHPSSSTLVLNGPNLQVESSLIGSRMSLRLEDQTKKASECFKKKKNCPDLTGPHVYKVTLYGADPTGQLDSTEALLEAFAKAANSTSRNLNQVTLLPGITDLGGVHIHLEGGTYLISKPLQLPVPRLGNIMISGGTLRASDDFPIDGHLINLSPLSSSSPSSYNYEYITIKDMMLDCKYRAGGISIINSVRINIDNCYITHFNSEAIRVVQGHETYIRNTFIGQHITAGGDPEERTFTGTGIILNGNDNAITDVVIFSANVGVMVSGQANILSGVHCYNKATGLGGTGIYLKLPGFTQTRIVNCYLDYTSIVAEDPFQLSVTNSFFLGDANIILKSIKGVADGVTIVDNMFYGTKQGHDIVQLNGHFNRINQVVVDRNNADGMNLRSTVAKGSVQGQGTSWNVDFNRVLLFPNLINHVHYSFLATTTTSFPNHALRNVSQNQVVVESNAAVAATVFVTVDQSP